MHLESDEAFGCFVVIEIGGVHAVQPDADIVADRFDTEFIPICLFVGGLSRFVIDERHQPTTACLVVNASAPCSVGRVHFALVAMHTPVLVIRTAFAAELHTGVQCRVAESFKFQDKIAILLFGSHKAVRLARHRSSDQAAVFHPVGRFAVQLLETGKIFTIE